MISDNVLDKRKKSKGFTFLEVMVAVAVLSFALVSLMGAVNWNLDLTNRSNGYNTAANLANDIVSRIEVEGISKLGRDSGTFEDHPGFEWNLLILPYNLGQLDAKINIVNVLITWQEGEESYEINLAVPGY